MRESPEAEQEKVLAAASTVYTSIDRTSAVRAMIEGGGQEKQSVIRGAVSVRVLEKE